MPPSLITEISVLIENAKNKAVQYVNSSLVILYWRIGQTIHREILKEERAEYGEKIIKQLAKHLIAKYGKGFNDTNLFRMLRFFGRFPDERIVATLSPLLSWSHFVELMAFEDPLKRQFYTEICRIEHWSVRELRKKISGMLYERTVISHQPEKAIQQDLKTLQEKNEITQELVFRDPYILDFLALPATFSENNLENAILDDLCKFLQELGNDFCFIGRQKRITIDNDDYYIDLLMFHRSLCRLVAIELKLGKFNAKHKGQMELYLRWLNKYERKNNEGEPIGLILCAEKKEEHVELLELNKSGIHVAEYLTELPSKELLEIRLRKAVSIAQERQAQLENVKGKKYS